MTAQPPLLERLRAALRDRYAVEREIGRGGMAVVFGATDRKHNRPVAIKVLLPEVAPATGTERFLREIEIAARLQHPHIVPVYDSGEADGLLYYVMPFVEGESLRQRLDREGKLPVEEALAIAREMASALDYAHQNGVVHRDIKPENVLLTGGHAVIADFGIARALSAAGGTKLTGVGMAIGTPAYMSPEQATGGTDEVDSRSDIYSLGCVLYEMLSGSPPFTGPTFQAILAQVMTGPRPSVGAVRKDVAPEVGGAVTKALSTQPADRFATAREFAHALGTEVAFGERPGRVGRRLLVGGLVAAIVVAIGSVLWALGVFKSRTVAAGADVIAVLPFNTTGANVGYLGDGMVDLLSANLDAVGAIRTVDPRIVLRKWHDAGAGVEPLKVGRDVKAGAVLTGSVTEAGSAVRMSAELLAVDGRSLARATADGPVDSVLTLVDTLSLRLLRSIWQAREPMPDLRISAITTGSVDAIRAYLRGEGFYRQSQWDSARTAFERAVQLDSTFALAYERLSLTVGWAEGYTAPALKRYSALALKYADHLVPRERTLVRANQMFSEGDLRAIDTLRAFTAKYPDDVDGLYLLADVQYHSQSVLDQSPQVRYDAFERVLQLDSTLAPAVFHILDLSLVRGDSAVFARHMALLERIGTGDAVAKYRLAGEYRWGDPAERFARGVELLEEPGASGAMLGLMEAGFSGDEPMRQVIAVFDSAWGGPVTQATLNQMVTRGILRGAAGQPRAAARLFDSLNTFPNGIGGQLAARFVWLGYGDSALKAVMDRGLAETIKQNPANQPFIDMLGVLSRGDIAQARSLLPQLTFHGDTAAERRVAIIRQGLRGWLTILEGDTTAGVAAIDSAAWALGVVNGVLAPMRLEAARALAARPATRDQGIKRLRYGFETDFTYQPAVTLALGDALAAKGDRAGAAQAYSRFLSMFHDAEPSLQPLVADVRARLTRVTAEQGT